MCIDLSRLSQHVGELNDEERKELVIQLRNALKVTHHEIHSAVAKGDWVNLQRFTHNLKSNTRFYGADQLQRICMQGETLAELKPVPVESVLTWIIHFDHACEKVLAAMEKEIV